MIWGYSGGGGKLASSQGPASPLDTPFLWNNYNIAHGLAPVIPGAPGTTTAPGTVAGTAPLTYNPAVGGIPSVPDPLKAVQDAIAAYTANFNSLQELANKQTAANQAAAQQQANAAAQSAIQNALTNLPALQGMAGQMNAFNQAQAVKQVTDLYPQFKGNVAQLGADIADWAAGRISQPTVNRIVQSMAERGQAGGFGADSPSTNAALMALMGKTSEALQQQGLTGQNTLLAGLPKAPLMDVSNFMVTPNAILGQMGQPTSVSSLGFNPANIFSNLYNAQLQAALYRAAPDPAAAYNLAMGNLQGGLAAGGRAGAGPYAGTPTTGGTSSPEILKLLQDLINRGSGASSQPSAYYTPNAFVPTGETLPQRTDYSNYPGMESGGAFDVVQPGMDYVQGWMPSASDFVNPDGTYKTIPFAPDYPGDFFDELTGNWASELYPRG